jgi:hypothetical protein
MEYQSEKKLKIIPQGKPAVKAEEDPKPPTV